jgi:O-acetyl-ADP-ribose deacetylase (regulator of RNase III)
VGTGIAQFPVRECADIMLREAAKHFEQPTSVEKVYFVLFDQAAHATFVAALKDLFSSPRE